VIAHREVASRGLILRAVAQAAFIPLSSPLRRRALASARQTEPSFLACFDSFSSTVTADFGFLRWISMSASARPALTFALSSASTFRYSAPAALRSRSRRR